MRRKLKGTSHKSPYNREFRGMESIGKELVNR